LIPVRTGVGFKIVALLDPLADESAELVARMAIGLGFGRVEGAV
jgi:hypothetical protein